MQTYKYPRTLHLDMSPGVQSDDKMLKSYAGLMGQEVVFTEKLDGENTTLYRHGLHARSMDGRSHPSRDWVKMFHGKIAHDIPEDLRICGENVYARHSVAYDSLDTYFYGFSVWRGENVLSWDETLTWFELLGIIPVPVLYRGEFSLEALDVVIKQLDTDKQEGFVVRCTAEFTLKDFERSAPKIAKWVRKGHVQTDQHWMHSEIVPNILKDKNV